MVIEDAPGFLLRILSATTQPPGTPGDRQITYLIIRPPYAHVEEELRRAFAGRDDIRIVVDRRQGERRSQRRPVPAERRRTDRRRAKEELVEIVVVRAPAGSGPPDAGRS